MSCPKERRFSMTMFSMRPQFNLAEFLAVPAPVGGVRARGRRAPGTKFNRLSASKAEIEPAPVSKPDATDKQT